MVNEVSKNKVFKNEFDIVEAVVVGDQTAASIQHMFDQAAELCDGMRKTDKPILILDNLTKVGRAPTEGPKVVVGNVKNSNFDKFAFVGSGTLFRLGAILVLQAIGKGDSVKYFDDYDTAVSWLTAKNDS